MHRRFATGQGRRQVRFMCSAMCLALCLRIDMECGAEPSRAKRAVAVAANDLVPDEVLHFDVVIAGGSTAAFAAALASANSGARTALLEPTDWVGGQLTASGVPAVDEAWHKIGDPKVAESYLDVARVARDPANMTPSFLKVLRAIKDPGDCWVSRFCFCPDAFLANQLTSLERHAGDRLQVFTNTVVKQVELDATGRHIKSLTAISRQPRPHLAAGGYDRLPSQDLAEWYSPEPSERFGKRILQFASQDNSDRATVFIDATEWGELLALSGAPYLQGIETNDGGLAGDDCCGQATVFCFVEEYCREPADEAAPQLDVEHLGFGQYRDRADAWAQVWTYRRIRGHGPPAPGDLCLQNWGYSVALDEGGNDYPFGYLFISRSATERERGNWTGGVDLAVMAAAEARALAWHQWFKRHAPAGVDPRQIRLNSEVLGTTHGLAKLPYIRDTRRSIGLDGYVLRFADLAGPAARRTGTAFDDRVALGAYAADIHALANCKLPSYAEDVGDTLPFFIPFRALTNQRLENFLVAGKTMAQSFLANSATRLHPIEWSAGTAAGVAAAAMSRQRMSSRAALDSIAELQLQIRRLTPIEWTIDGRSYPGRFTHNPTGRSPAVPRDPHRVTIP